MVTRIDVAEVIERVAAGAKLLDALPHSIYVQEHLPGAESLPLETFRSEDAERFASDQPVIVYCFDQHCDLSSRMGHRLEMEGLTEVYDLIGGRASWTALGLPTEGSVADHRRISQYVEPVRTVDFDATMADVRAKDGGYPVVVVGPDDVVLGTLDATADSLPDSTDVARAMVPAPGTIRPETRVDDAVAQLRKDHLDHVLVTAVNGTLFGMVRTDEIHV